MDDPEQPDDYGDYDDYGDAGDDYGEPDDSYGSIKEEEKANSDEDNDGGQDQKDSQSQAIDLDDDIIDYLLSDESDMKADELLKNVENMILNKEESGAIYLRLGKLFNYIVKREVFVNMKDPQSSTVALEELTPFIKLLINGYHAVRFTQFSFFCIKPSSKYKLKINNQFFNNLIFLLSRKVQEIPGYERSLIQFLEFMTAPSDSFALGVKKPGDAILNYMVERIYEEPNKQFFRFLALVFMFLPMKIIPRFCEELLLPSKVLVESSLQLNNYDEESKSNSMDGGNTIQAEKEEEMNYEILRFLMLTLFNVKSRKTLIAEKTYLNLYHILRNSYSIFTPKRLKVSHKNRMAMLQIIASQLSDIEESDLEEFAEGVYNDIMYSIDKNEISFIINIISPIISAPNFNFLPVCIHFDDDIDNIITNLKFQSEKTKNSQGQVIQRGELNSDLLSEPERDNLLTNLQKLSINQVFKNKTPPKASGFEWKRVLEINFEKPFGGQPDTINKELNKSENTLFIFQCLIGQEICKIGVFTPQKLTKGTSQNSFRVEQASENYLFYYTQNYKLHIPSDEVAKNVQFIQNYGGMMPQNLLYKNEGLDQIIQDSNALAASGGLFNKLKGGSNKTFKRFCLEYKDSCFSMYYDNGLVLKYEPQNPDAAQVRFDASFMWSVEEKNGMPVKVQPLATDTLCFVQGIEVWVGDSTSAKAQQAKNSQEYLLGELKENLKDVYSDAFFTLREGKPVYLAPRSMTVAEFLTNVFNQGEIIVPNFNIRCLASESLDLLTPIDKLLSMYEGGDLPQILDLFIASPLGAKGLEASIKPKSDIFETLLGFLTHKNTKFARELLSADRLQQFFRKVSLTIIKNNQSFLETYTILAEEIEVFSSISSYSKYLTESGDFFNHLFQLLNSSYKKGSNKVLILKITNVMYRALEKVFRSGDLSFLVSLNLPNFVHILLKKIEFLNRAMESSPESKDPDENPFIDDQKQQKKKKGSNWNSSMLGIVQQQVQQPSQADHFSEEQFKKNEKLMNEILNSVFLCLTKLMENEMSDDFYSQIADKIKMFKFVKVISKMLSFFDFSDSESVRLYMQRELLKLLEMWASHEGLTHIFWEDVQDTSFGKSDGYTFYQKIMALVDQVNIGSYGEQEDIKLTSMKDQMKSLIQQIDVDLRKFYTITITEQTTDVTKNLSLPLKEAYPNSLNPYLVDQSYIRNPASGKWEHHYEKNFSSGNLSKTKTERIIKELKDLSESLPCSPTNAIFLRYDQSRMDVMKALIMGSAETPYAHGAFEFDIHIGDNYPNGPPTVNLMTTGRNTVRFNPNLYSCGKVCLSLLGTWRGSNNENWNPKFSTILQILISIQSIIMTEDVYYNEPGYENSKKTDDGKKLNEGYSNIVKYANIRHAMIDQINSPSRCFKEPILIHFYLKKDMILKECQQWLELSKTTTGKYTGLVSSHNHSLAGKFTQSGAYNTNLKKAIDDLKQTLGGLNLTIEKTFKIKKVSYQKKNRKPKAAAGSSNQPSKPIYEDISKVDVGYDENDQPDTKPKVIDVNDEKVTNRWSRYIGALGIEAVQKQASSTVFLIGLNPLGLEIAKNIVLSGVKKITLYDPKVVEPTDLCGNFYLSERDIGKNRAKACLNKLQALNNYVQIDIFEKQLHDIEGYNMVISTQGSIETLLMVNQICRSRGIGFISATIQGLFSRVFCDFGSNFQIIDKTGEEQVEIVATSVNNQTGLVTLLEGSKHNLQDNDMIKFAKADEEGAGNSFVNTVHKVIVNNKNSFFVPNVQDYKTFKSGLIKTMKSQAQITFKPLVENLESPKFDETISGGDFYADPKFKLLHFAFIAIDDYLESHGLKDFNRPLDMGLVDQITSTAFSALQNKYPDAFKTLKETKELSNCQEYIALMMATWSGIFPPMCAFLGGVIAQEFVKGVTKKYMPINQFFYYECSELVFENRKSIYKLPFDPKDKYQPLKTCLSVETAAKLRDVRLFMVGSGAIGCELLKNYAMIGLGSGTKGRIVLTDPDVIENSNLNRQFLFREKHLRQPKSTTAAAVAVQMNPDLKDKIFAMLEKIHEKTENIFTDQFFDELDIVTNALDNINARKYVDSRCVKSRRPLIESGTLGPRGHVQVILPYLTESYGSQQDPQEEGEIPYCTLKMFPEETVHCIEWARDKFNKMFTSKPTSFVKTIESLNSGSIDTLDDKILAEALKFAKQYPSNFDDCLQWARNKFHKLFVHDIDQLLYTYPLDKKTDNGNLFWSLPKRPPTAIKYNPNEQTHAEMITAAACLRAVVFGINLPQHPRNNKTQLDLADKAGKMKLKEFKISIEKAKELEAENEKQGKPKPDKIEEEKQEAAEGLQSKEEMIAELYKVLKAKKPKDLLVYKINPQEFEKDEDENFHVDFISALTNLRAANYKLEKMDWINVKLKAGKIVPALATTTAAISGLQTIELCKVIAKCKLEEHKNSFLNLSLPLLAQSEPLTAPSYQLTKDLKVNLWDRWDIDLVKNPSITSIKALFEHLEKKTGMSPQDLMKGNTPVFVSSLMNLPMKAKEKERILNGRIEDILELEDEPTNFVDLTITFTTKESLKTNPKDPNIKGVPPVRIMFKQQ